MTGIERIQEALAQGRRRRQTALVPFLTVGYPDLAATVELVAALAQGGAALVELGVPFSDPLADGTTIQRASQVALSQGVTLTRCLEVCGQLRGKGLTLPLILMGYYNPILAYGVAPFCAHCRSNGVDGIIVADLPPEEAAELRAAAREQGLALVFLVAPTSTPERIRKVCTAASGFIYCVSVTGVTGARESLPPELPEFLGRVRAQTSLPLVVGFGVSQREQVAALGGLADGVVVGSALIDHIEALPPSERVAGVRSFIQDLRRHKTM